MCVPKGIPELPHLLTEALPQRSLLDILAEEIQIFFLEELHRIDTVKLRKDIVPQVAAAYYSGGIIQILRYWVTSRDSLSEELLVKQEKYKIFKK